MMNKENVELLVSAAKKGCEKSMLEIINLFRPLVLKQVKKYNFLMDSEDIISNCNLSIILAINKYKLEKNCFSSYVKNTIENNLKYKFRSKSFYESPATLDNIETNDLLNIENDVIEKILIEKINGAMAILNDYEKELINLRFKDRLSLMKISKIKGKSMYRIDKDLKFILTKIKSSF